MDREEKLVKNSERQCLMCAVHRRWDGVDRVPRC